MLLTNRKSPRGSSTAAMRLPGWWYLHISGSDHLWHSPPAFHFLSFQPFIAPSLTLEYQVFPIISCRFLVLFSSVCNILTPILATSHQPSFLSICQFVSLSLTSSYSKVSAAQNMLPSPENSLHCIKSIKKRKKNARELKASTQTHSAICFYNT